MRVRATAGPPATIEADVLAVPIFREDAEMAADLAELDAASGGAISRASSGATSTPRACVALVDAGTFPPAGCSSSTPARGAVDRFAPGGSARWPRGS